MKKNNDPQWVNDTKKKIREKIEKHGSVEAALEADIQNIIKCDHIVGGYAIDLKHQSGKIPDADKDDIWRTFRLCPECGKKLNLK